MTRQFAKVTIFLCLMEVWCGVSAVAGPNGPPVGMVTRYVKLFWTLEQELQTALSHNDKSKVDALLASDFEMWTGSRAGEPVPRGEWISAITNHPDQLSSRSIVELSAKELEGKIVSVSYKWTGSPDIFVVDIWKEIGGHWMLFTRYASLAGANTPIPGWNPNDLVIEKKI